MAPLAPLAIGLGTSLGSSLLGKLFAPKPTAAQTSATNLLSQTQQNTAAQGSSLFDQGSQAVAQPLNYWSGILSGNKSTIASTLAPEIGQIGAGYDAAARTSAALNPRGGPSSTFLADLPFQKQRDVSTLFQTARPQAASSLASAGSSLIGQGIGAEGVSANAGGDILAAQQKQNELAAQQGGKIGSGLFSMIQTYGFPALANANPGLFGGLAKSGVNVGSGAGGDI